MWVIFGKYKWTKACVNLAKDDKPVNMSLEAWLHKKYAAYRHRV